MSNVPVVETVKSCDEAVAAREMLLLAPCASREIAPPAVSTVNAPVVVSISIEPLVVSTSIPPAAVVVILTASVPVPLLLIMREVSKAPVVAIVRS